MREERQRAAAMRYDDAHVRATAERPRCNQVHDHPRSIEREFHDRRGKAQLLDVKSRRRDRMHEHDRLAPVEFIENRIEPFVAEIDAVDVRKQDDAVELEHVERMGNLRQRAVDIRQRQQRKAADPLWMIGNQLCVLLVDLTRQGARRSSRNKLDARRRDRQQLGLDSIAVH